MREKNAVKILNITSLNNQDKNIFWRTFLNIFLNMYYGCTVVIDHISGTL